MFSICPLCLLLSLFPAVLTLFLSVVVTYLHRSLSLSFSLKRFLLIVWQRRCSEKRKKERASNVNSIAERAITNTRVLQYSGALTLFLSFYLCSSQTQTARHNIGYPFHSTAFSSVEPSVARDDRLHTLKCVRLKLCFCAVHISISIDNRHLNMLQHP